MAMVQRIVRWHEGTIDVESTPGQGTSISICLPEASQEAAPPSHMAYHDNSSVPIPNPDILPWKILLVEDQPEVMRIHKAFLTTMGLRVFMASDGQEAFELYRNTTPGDINMIITDYMMPEMDGMELAKKIRQLDQGIPIIMITAFGEDQALSSLTMDNIDMLKKPLSYKLLTNHILKIQAKGNHGNGKK
jgi:CheY-like chemotaxis protein